jgi:hypothetical protein
MICYLSCRVKERTAKRNGKYQQELASHGECAAWDGYIHARFAMTGKQWVCRE